MRISIATKVFATLLAATSLVVVGMYVFMQHSFEQGFLDLVEARHQQRLESLSQRLAGEYREARGWERLRGDPRRWRYLLRDSRQRPDPPDHGGDERAADFPPPVVDRADPGAHLRPPKHVHFPRLVLLGADKSVIFGQVRDIGQLRLSPVVVNNATVGYLGVVPGPPPRELAEIRFEQRHMRSLLTIAIAMLILSAALGLPLAYTLARPLRRIALVTQQLAQGRYEARLPVTTHDEIGQLAGDINDLARALQETEQSRRLWVADISHELRTPLAVLRSEIEASQDGLRPLSGEVLDSFHGEVMRISHLVDELYQLSLSDVGALSYHKTRIEPLRVLRETLAALSSEFHNRDIEVKLDTQLGKAVFCHADRDKMAQLFRNLLMNSCKYTDPGGHVALQVSLQKDQLLLDIQDTHPGVPEAALNRLFERFYRAEPSRNRLTGGAGLGLAICRNIVMAHDGSIDARHSPLGGVWIHLELPVAP